MTSLKSLLRSGLLAALFTLSQSAAIEAPRVGPRDINTTTQETTAWGATCTDRNLTITLRRTSQQTFTNETYGHEVFFALTNKEILMDGTYIISTRECVPANSYEHADTIQILAHGATYTKHMWDFPYEPERYSWTRRFNLEGYTTFAFDLLGAGNSTRPHGIFEAQTQAHVEIVRQMTERLRAGEIDEKQWKKIIYVGFSIGASVGNSVATQYPTHTDQLVLLGHSWYTRYIYPALLYMLRDQANRINATRWGNFPDYYTTMPSLVTRDFSHLYGEYDGNVSAVDYEDLDADTLGEAVSFAFHADTAPEYRNPVFLALGNNDATFCGVSCDGIEREVYSRFPLAKDHFAKAYANTGHNILLHYSGAELMDDAVAFLNEHDSDPRVE